MEQAIQSSSNVLPHMHTDTHAGEVSGCPLFPLLVGDNEGGPPGTAAGPTVGLNCWVKDVGHEKSSLVQDTTVPGPPKYKKPLVQRPG